MKSGNEWRALFEDNLTKCIQLLEANITDQMKKGQCHYLEHPRCRHIELPKMQAEFKDTGIKLYTMNGNMYWKLS